MPGTTFVLFILYISVVIMLLLANVPVHHSAVLCLLHYLIYLLFTQISYVVSSILVFVVYYVYLRGDMVSYIYYVYFIYQGVTSPLSSSSLLHLSTQFTAVLIQYALHGCTFSLPIFYPCMATIVHLVYLVYLRQSVNLLCLTYYVNCLQSIHLPTQSDPYAVQSAILSNTL